MGREGIDLDNPAKPVRFIWFDIYQESGISCVQQIPSPSGAQAVHD